MGVAKVRVRDRIVRRQEILLAAGRVFIKKGSRLATMEDIASAASVGVGTLYHYFRSKEQMDKVMATAAAKKTVADLPNFATGGFTVLVSEIA